MLSPEFIRCRQITKFQCRIAEFISQTPLKINEQNYGLHQLSKTYVCTLYSLLLHEMTGLSLSLTTLTPETLTFCLLQVVKMQDKLAIFVI